MEWVWPLQPDQYSIYVIGSSNSSWSDFWIAAFGALVGAGAAFALEAMRRMTQERRRRIAAGNLALLTMFRMWWEIYNYEKKIIREAVLKKDPLIPLWIRISLLARTPADLRFDAPSLVFLLRSSDPTRLASTILQESRYHELFQVIQLRNTVLMNAQENMAHKGVGIAGAPSDKELVDAIGISDIVKLRTLTVGIFESVYQNLTDMSVEYAALRNLLEKEFGKRHVVAFQLEQKYPDELPNSVEQWLGLLKIESNSRPAGRPF